MSAAHISKETAVAHQGGLSGASKTPLRFCTICQKKLDDSNKGDKHRYHDPEETPESWRAKEAWKAMPADEKAAFLLASAPKPVARTEAPPEQSRASAEKVLELVEKHMGVAFMGRSQKSRPRDIALARHLAMFLLSEDVGLIHRDIAKVLGGMSRAAVSYGVNKVKENQKSDAKLLKDIEGIRSGYENPPPSSPT